jgi:hypothetical protein
MTKLRTALIGTLLMGVALSWGQYNSGDPNSGIQPNGSDNGASTGDPNTPPPGIDASQAPPQNAPPSDPANNSSASPNDVNGQPGANGQSPDYQSQPGYSSVQQGGQPTTSYAPSAGPVNGRTNVNEASAPDPAGPTTLARGAREGSEQDRSSDEPQDNSKKKLTWSTGLLAAIAIAARIGLRVMRWRRDD